VRVLVFDVETVAAEEELSYRDFSYLKGREPQKTDRELLDELSLNPFLSSVVALAFVLEEEKPLLTVLYLTDREEEAGEGALRYMGKDYPARFYPFHFKELWGDDFYQAEKELIKRFWAVLELASPRLVSFNGKRFDVPFLRIRSFRYDLPVPQPFENGEHLDVLEFLFKGKNFSHSSYSLDFVARHFGLKSPKQRVDGSAVRRLFLEGKYEEVAKYCALDALTLYELYKKLERLVDDREPPTENQLRYLTDLFTKLPTEEADLEWRLARKLTKSSASTLIELLKQLVYNT